MNEVKEFQPGVKFLVQSFKRYDKTYTYTIKDIDVDDNVDCVTFYGPNSSVFTKIKGNKCIVRYELKDCLKQFKNVKKLFFSEFYTDDSSSDIVISNFMFPNVEDVESDNENAFKPGSVLIRGNVLLNTFCKKPGECIDLHGVESIKNYAFEGCMSKNIINTMSVSNIMNAAFRCSILSLEQNEYEPFSLKTKDFDRLIIATTGLQEIMLDDNTYAHYAIDTSDMRKISVKVKKHADIYKKITPPFKEHQENLELISVETEDSYISPFCLTNLSDSFLNAELEVKSKYYVCENGVVYTNDKKVIVCARKNMTGEFIVPESVEIIWEDAFKRCNIESLTINHSLKMIKKNAFTDCDNLKSVNQLEGTKINIIEMSAFSYCHNLQKININAEQINAYAFYDDYALSEIKLGEDIVSIGINCFSGGTISKEEQSYISINLPKSLCSIEQCAFTRASELHINSNVFPVGLIESLVGGCNSTDKVFIKKIIHHLKDGTVKTYFIPCCVINTCNVSSIFALSEVPDNYIDIIANNIAPSTLLDYVLLIYQETKDETLKNYLSDKKLLGYAITRLLKDDTAYTRNILHILLSMHILSDRKLKSIHEKIKDRGDVVLSAEVLNEISLLNAKKNAKTGRKDKKFVL